MDADRGADLNRRELPACAKFLPCADFECRRHDPSDYLTDPGPFLNCLLAFVTNYCLQFRGT